jgi:PelA/Pel-15E family pectate lyase
MIEKHRILFIGIGWFIPIVLIVLGIILIIPPFPVLSPHAAALQAVIGTVAISIWIVFGTGWLKKPKTTLIAGIAFGACLTTMIIISSLLCSVDFSFWIIREGGPFYELAFTILWIAIFVFYGFMTALSCAIFIRDKQNTAISFQKFRKALIFGFLGFLILASSGFVIYGVTYETRDYPGCVKASSPFFAIPTGLHYNSALDHLTGDNLTILNALEKAAWAFQKLRQPCGGFPMYATPDFCTFVGDGGRLYPNEIDLQAGTPRVGLTYLQLYRMEPNPMYLQLAKGCADALVEAQDDLNGGFYKYARFDENNKIIEPSPRNPRRHSSYDDNTVQGCMSFLLEIYNETRDSKYLTALNKGLDGIFATQYSWGAWPQETNYIFPYYQIWSTLNDGLMDDMLRMLLKAANILPDRQEECLNSINKAVDWLLIVQGNGGSTIQQAWAQQYDFNHQPAWARRFEPPAFDAAVSAELGNLFIDLYCTFNQTKYLDPLPGLIAWFNASYFSYTDEEGQRVTGWARLYEPITNIPIFGIAEGGWDRDPQYVYSLSEARSGYNWKGTYANALFDRWNYLQSVDYNITAYQIWRYPPLNRSSAYGKALNAANQLNTDGFWIDSSNRIHISQFNNRMTDLTNYLSFL